MNTNLYPNMDLSETKERHEIEHLFKAINARYGYDFHHYAYDSARRRVLHRMQLEGLESISALQVLVSHNESSADNLLKDLSINVTEMFRDPLFFSYLRESVLPLSNQKSKLKIWHAGCSNGMEAYSMAILLTELARYKNSLLYATDFNRSIIEEAKTGIYPINTMSKNTRNYHRSGGTRPFSDYYHARFNNAVITSSLKENIRFTQHNLACDAGFYEMDLIVCRNVLIYFDRTLQDRVFKLFLASLRPGGILCLGSSETLQLSGLRNHFSVVSKEHKIYQKKSSAVSP